MRVQPFQSQTYTWAASKTFPIDLSFLNAARDMKAPVIDELTLVLNITDIDTGSAGILGGCFPAFFSQILVQDQAGERWNTRGASARVIDQIEYGCGYQDVAAIAASQSNVARKVLIRLPFNPPKARRRRDFGLPLRGFLDGGKMQVTTSAALNPAMGANGGTLAAATIMVVAWVRDEGVREAKSRLVFRDESINVPNFDYNIAGSLRYALAYNGEINEITPTAWSAQTVSSRTLELQQIDDFILQDRATGYHKPARSSPGIVATADAYKQTDCVLTGQVVPVYVPSEEQKIPDMPQMQTLNYKSSLSSITTADLPQMITSVVTERSANVTARVLGVSDPSAAVAARGRIKTANGNPKGVNAFPPNIAKMLPVKISRGQ